MKYVNIKTGVVISTPCKCEGGDWKELESSKEAKKEKKTNKGEK